METKRQVRKEGILSGFFDGKWNCTGGNFLTPKDLQLDGKVRINAFNLPKEGEMSAQSEGTNNMKVDVDGKWRSLVGS